MPEWGKERTLQEMRARGYRITAWGLSLCGLSLPVLMENLCSSTIVRTVVGQLEKCPETGRLHGQLFVVFTDEPRGKAAKKRILDGLQPNVTSVWIDQADASGWVNQLYCTKKDTRIAGPWYFGEKIKQIGTGQGRRSDINMVVNRMRKGERLEQLVQEEDVAVPYVRFHSGFEKLQALLRRARPFKKMKVLWYWGVSGSGKTRAAVEKCGDRDFVIITGAGEKRPFYHDDYIPGIHEVVIYDDLRPTDMNYNILLQKLDGYPVTVDCRGVNKAWLVSHIIITSCSPPHDFPTNGEDIEQLLRRITKIKEFSRIVPNPNEHELGGGESPPRSPPDIVADAIRSGQGQQQYGIQWRGQ